MSSADDLQKKGTVTFSGVGARERRFYHDQAEQQGWAVSNVAAKLDILVVGPDASERKIANARRRGLIIITYDDWEKRIAEPYKPDPEIPV